MPLTTSTSVGQAFRPYYDRDGNTISDFEWAKLFSDEEYKIIAKHTQTTQFAGVTVSTVWLGIDHNFLQEGKPMIFETMVFRNQEGVSLDMDEITYRYSTEKQALAGHDICVYNAWRWIRGVPCSWDDID